MAPRTSFYAALSRSITLCTLTVASHSFAAAQALPQVLTPSDLAILEDRFLDQVLVVAGDQVVTRSDVFAHIQSPQWRDRIEGYRNLPANEANAEMQKANIEAAAELVESLLVVRAGEDRGFDPSIVDSLVERRFKEAIERSGGYRNFHKELQRFGTSPEAYKERTRRTIVPTGLARGGRWPPGGHYRSR